METEVPDIALCESCGSAMEQTIEDYIYGDTGIEIVVRDCEVRRCECGTVIANFDPKEVERELAMFLLTTPEPLSIQQARFLFGYVMSRMENNFTYFNFVGEA